MALVDHGRAWDEASSPSAARQVRSFEHAWRMNPADPPDPCDFLPGDADRRPGVLLALLRADLTLRRASGRPVHFEAYCRGWPDLPDDVVVALAYEDFCLREEAGESPVPAEYESTFPRLSTRLREIFDIHEMLGSARSLLPSTIDLGEADTALPQSGQAIGGFQLVEELGKGTFSRVFLARERPLADRPVALKVTRVGSPEPQALARLQHTHIVPVHSYHVDPATGLHLLCMPYFGRLTLAQVIAQLRGQERTRGTDLLDALDQLCRSDDARPPASEVRHALATRTFAQAVAWWGARLAEALQHAHDQGVLHRDVKPSNILVTASAVPMLLDFNLSRPVQVESGHDSDPLGGTLAYMAPEHMEALAGRDAGPIDCRADVYSLGVVIFELLAHRPFPTPLHRQAPLDALLDAVAQRRAWTPEPRAGDPPIPAPLKAVLSRCLAADPIERYATAADLAADLRAVADDGPLAVAREPEPSRTLRWAQRNRRGVVFAFLAIAGVGALFRAQASYVRREAFVKQTIRNGEQSTIDGNFAVAVDQFTSAELLASAIPELPALRRTAAKLRHDAVMHRDFREEVDRFFADVKPVRFRLVQFKGLKNVNRDLTAALSVFGVLDDSVVPWTRRPELSLLDPERRTRLIDEINELLFLWVIASNERGEPTHVDPELAPFARAMCDRALTFAEPKAPWHALRQHYASPGAVPMLPVDPSAERSARVCFQWAYLAYAIGKFDLTSVWLNRAVQLQPDGIVYRFALANHYDTLREPELALRHYEAALAREPQSSWVLLNRARLERDYLRNWALAREDFAQAVADPQGIEPARIELERGTMAQRVGDFATALKSYEAAIVLGPTDPAARSARINRAAIHGELGATNEARADLDRVLREKGDHPEASVQLALLTAQRGGLTAAEAALTRLMHSEPLLGPARRAELLEARAGMRLLLNRGPEAYADAAQALVLQPTLSHRRLEQRTALAARQLNALAAIQPDEIGRWPWQGRRLAKDLGAALDQLEPTGDRSANEAAYSTHRLRAVLLSALDRHADALAQADRAVATAPLAGEALLTRATVRRRAGDKAGALADLDHALRLVGETAPLREARGRLLTEMGRPSDALTDLKNAVLADGGPSVSIAVAEALAELGRTAEAINHWSRALSADPHDPEVLLGRARCCLRLGQWDEALADLETAAALSSSQPRRLAEVAQAYSLCVVRYPDRISRVLTLTRRAAQADR
jgi:serine/threonine protein kinase/tetratricopeptide (TPR) repeat protein